MLPSVLQSISARKDGPKGMRSLSMLADLRVEDDMAFAIFDPISTTQAALWHASFTDDISQSQA